MTGSAYPKDLDAILGKSQHHAGLGILSDLRDCVAFTEPAAFSHAGHLYLAMNCARENEAATEIVLFKQSHPSGQWSYVGPLLGPADARALKTTYMSAADLFSVAGQVYLAASPADSSYRGCVFYKIVDLEKRIFELAANGEKKVIARIDHDPAANLTGACTFDESLKVSGALYLKRFDKPVMLERFVSLYRSNVNFATSPAPWPWVPVWPQPQPQPEQNENSSGGP